MRNKLSFIGAGLLISALALTGCAEEPETIKAIPGSSQNQDSESEKREDQETNKEDEEKRAAEEKEAGAIDYSDSAACVVGDWVADHSLFMTFPMEEGGRLVSIEGDVVVNYSDVGTIMTYYNDWTLTYEVEGIQSVINRDGIDAGFYEVVSQNKMNMWDSNIGSELTVSVLGQAMSVPPEPNSFANTNFTCSETEMTIDAYGATHLMHRK